jgi:hypothetical protein
MFFQQTKLILSQNGISSALGNEKDSHSKGANEAFFEVEDRSFWFRHRNDCIQELVRSFWDCLSVGILWRDKECRAGNAVDCSLVADCPTLADSEISSLLKK